MLRILKKGALHTVAHGKFPMLLLAILMLALMPAAGLEVNTWVDSVNPSFRAWVSVAYVPNREPIGGLEIKLQLAPSINVSSLTLSTPEKGAWSQIKPELQRSGNTLVIHTISPVMLNSKDTSRVPILKLQIDLADSAELTEAGDIIENIQLNKAITTAGEELPDIKLTLNDIMNIKGYEQNKGQNPDVSYRCLNRRHTLSFNLAKELKVKGKVMDIKGNTTMLLLDGTLSPGVHSLSWNGRNRTGNLAPPGIYFLQVELGTFTYNKKVRHAL